MTMNILALLHRPLVCLSALALPILPSSAAAGDYKPELFKKARLVYADDFSAGTLNKDFWEVRQGSTWEVRDGVLTGGPSPKEYQEKKVAEGDPGHAGFKPVIWLKQVPENFIITMRLRHDAESYHPKFPLLDLGHHIHTLVFGERQTTLTIKKKVETVTVDAPLLALNQWHEVAVELKPGKLLLSIDGSKHLFESPNIDMAGQAQIDFKGVDLGACHIDDVKLWAGE